MIINGLYSFGKIYRIVCIPKPCLRRTKLESALLGVGAGDNPGLVSVGHQVDITTALQHFGDRCIIVGNLDPSLIQNGTPDQVYDACRFTPLQRLHDAKSHR